MYGRTGRRTSVGEEEGRQGGGLVGGLEGPEMEVCLVVYHLEGGDGHRGVRVQH